MKKKDAKKEKKTFQYAVCFKFFEKCRHQMNFRAIKVGIPSNCVVNDVANVFNFNCKRVRCSVILQDLLPETY